MGIEDYSFDPRLQKLICKDCGNLEFYCGFFCKKNLHEDNLKKTWRRLLDWRTPLNECKYFIQKGE